MTISGQTGSSTGPAFPGMSRYTSFTVTANFSTGTGTFGIAVDTQVGTAWVNVARSTNLTTSGVESLVLASRQNHTAAEVVVTSDAGGGTVRGIPLHDNVRIRVIETTATLMSGVVTLYAVG
jgi:hypothetical protein